MCVNKKRYKETRRGNGELKWTKPMRHISRHTVQLTKLIRCSWGGAWHTGCGSGAMHPPGMEKQSQWLWHIHCIVSVQKEVWILSGRFLLFQDQDFAKRYPFRWFNTSHQTYIILGMRRCVLLHTLTRADVAYPMINLFVRLTQTGQCTQYILRKCTCTIIRENVHVPLSGKMYMYNYPGKCTCTIIRENVQVKLSLLGLSGGHIGNRILLNVIPTTLYSIMSISHKMNTLTSFDTEARKDGSLLPPPTVSNQRLTSWDRYPLDE